MLRRALAHRCRRSSTTTQQRPVVKQLLNAIRKTPWWAGGDVERNRTLFEELMERGNARCPHLGSTHEATTTDHGGVRIAPRDGDAKATICFVHGGGFFAGSPHAYRGAVASLIARVPGGCTALLPKYRRAPEFTISDAVDDVVEQYNELSGPIVLAGDSAGAYLCLRAAQQLSSKPAGVLLWCPYLLHHPTKDVSRSLSSEGDFLDVSSLQPARHVNDEQNDARHAYALTASGVDDMMIISGEQETLHVDALTLALTAKASDTNVTHKTYAEMFHDFMLFPKFLKEVRSRRPAVLRRLHAIDARRLRESRSWVVSFLVLGPFGPRRSAQAEDALQVSAEYIAQRCDPVEESEVDRLRRELAEALEKDDEEEAPSEATSDNIEDWAKRVSRFVGVAWDEKRRKWKVTLNELDGKDRTIGRYDDEREAAYARNKAVLDAGLEGRRRMNAVDEHGVLVPPGAPHRRAKASVIAPDPLAVTKYGVSKYWGVTWDRKGRVWRAQYTDGDGKRKSVGRYGNEEEAAYAYNDAIREAGLEGVRKVNPVVDGKLALKPPLRDPTAAQQSKYWGVTWARKQSKQFVTSVCSTALCGSHRSFRPPHAIDATRFSPVGLRRWRATYNDANTVKRHIGYFDDQEAAALAVNKAIIDAGLAGLRRMNEIDEDGMPVPRPWGGGD